MSNDWTLGSPTEIGKILFCDELSEDDPDIFGLGIIHCSLITSFCTTKATDSKTTLIKLRIKNNFSN